MDIVFRDLTKPGSPFEVLVWGLDSHFQTIYAKGIWVTKTDYKAPNGKIVAADPGVLPDAWKTIVPEGKDTIINEVESLSKTVLPTANRLPSGATAKAGSHAFRLEPIEPSETIRIGCTIPAS